MRLFSLLLAAASAASVSSSPIGIFHSPQAVAPVSKWSLSPRLLFERAPTYHFQNCSPEQEQKIKDALADIQTLAGRILDQSDTVQSDQLVYKRIFGHDLLAEAVNQNYAQQVTLVRANLQRIATLDQSNVVILFNCDPNGELKRNQGTKECANTYPEIGGITQMNLFGNPATPNDGGFLNAPAWADTMVELSRNANGEAGPATVVCSNLDFLMRTDRIILFHELMHVTGLGMRQDGSRIIDQQLRSGLYAYGQNGVQQLAFENPQAAVENADSYAAYVTAVATLHEDYYTEAAQDAYNRIIGFEIWQAGQQPPPAPASPPPGYSPPPYNDTPLEYGTGGTPPPGVGGSAPYLFGGVDPFNDLPGWQPPGTSGGGSGGSYFA